MATDIILEKDFISLVGGRVEVDSLLKVKNGLQVEGKINVGRTAISDINILADVVNARKQVTAKKVVAKVADIGKLNIFSTVGEKSVPGKITIGNTTLTDEEIRCKKISAPSFLGWSAKVIKLDVTGEIEAKKINVSGDVTAKKFKEVSDARCKQDITVLTNSLDKILCLQGVSFNWEENDLTGLNPPKEKQLGFIAQDVEKVLPDAVSKDEMGRRSLAYSSIIPLLVEGMKTQQKDIRFQNEQLEAKSQENKILQQKIVGIERKLDILLNKLAL